MKNILNNMKFFLKNLLSSNNKKPYKNHLYCIDHNNGFYVENYFHELLSLEKKRTERSRKPFLLMLVHIQNHLGSDEASEIRKRIPYVLHSITRETDIKGWYKHDSVIGVICTEINGTDKALIKQKLYNKLSNILELKWVKKIDLSFHVFPEEYDKKGHDTPPDLELYPDLSKQNTSRKTALFIKRIIDITGSAMLLVIFSPFFLIIPILIKLSSEGPVFFRQERIGHLGKKFIFLKFRTMHINNNQDIHREYIKKLINGQEGNDAKDRNEEKNCSYKLKNDPRITLIGRFLRKSSVDEFPQFLNVLIGEMSLVGPRPPIPYELESYDIWHRKRILEIRPGITGVWQVHGRSSTTFDEMVRMDIKYIREWSLLLDIKLLLKTPWVVLTGKGAY